MAGDGTLRMAAPLSSKAKSYPIRNSRWAKFTLVLLSLSFSITIAEIALRRLAPPTVVQVGTAQTDKARLYGWSLPPNSRLSLSDPDSGRPYYFRINSQGWKDVEHQFKKPRGTFRILFLGDSVTYGYVPLESLYTRKVEQLLKEKGLGNVEVITMGVGGWGTDQELEALVLEGLQYQPDLVIYQFCGNDIHDNMAPWKGLPADTIWWKKPFKYEIRNGRLTRVSLKNSATSRELSSAYMKKPFLNSALAFNIIRVLRTAWTYYHDLAQSTIANTTQQSFQDEARLRNSEETPTKPEKEKTHVKKNPLSSPAIDPTTDYYEYNPEGESHGLRKHWELFGALVLKMKEVTEQRNARLIIFSEESDEGKREWCIRAGWFSTDGKSDFVLFNGKQYSVDWKRPLKSLSAICTKYEIPLIEPKSKYERFHNDSHPNITGNLRMAEDIVDFLLNSFPEYIEGRIR